MPIVSTVVQDAVLTALIGLYDHLDLALFAGDPADDGVELAADGGYARVTVSVGDWSAAEDGSISAGPVEFFDATGEWSDTATHWCLVTPAGDLGPSGALTDPLDVAGPGPVTLASVTVFFADTVTADDSDD